jgi:hypothetical protein
MGGRLQKWQEQPARNGRAFAEKAEPTQRKALVEITAALMGCENDANK